MEASSIQPNLLDAVGLSKDYAGTRALDGVDFNLRTGEVHILFGENGAGKSTLISILAGAQKHSDGEIRLHGRKVHISSVHEARKIGISAVFQEFSLVPQMTVEENIFLGAEETKHGFIRRKDMRRGARELLDRLRFKIDARRRVESLPRAQQQMVEIAKAFHTNPKILILDEPTASLTDSETDTLFDLVAELKSRGVGIIYITHRMNEIRRIGDRVTVLRDGKYIATVDAKTTSQDELVHLMTGRVISEIFPSIDFSPAQTALETKSLSVAGGVHDVSLYVRAGEVVGLAGLIGSGKSEFARACFGLEKITAGEITLHNKNVTGFMPREMLKAGFFYVPSDRRDEGLIMMRSCRENISLPSLEEPAFYRHGFLRRNAERTLTRDLAKRFNLSPMRPELAAEFFSGGNQQKIMLAKCLTREATIFAFDEPTVGVDVATRAEIYQFIKELCENGAAVLLISSDLPEVLHLSNRLYIFCRGRIHAELEGDEITEQRALSHFFEREAA